MTSQWFKLDNNTYINLTHVVRTDAATVPSRPGTWFAWMSDGTRYDLHAEEFARLSAELDNIIAVETESLRLRFLPQEEIWRASR